MKNIILIGARLTDNLGGPSLAVSTVEVLKSVYPNSTFTLLVPEKAYPNDLAVADKYPLTVLPFHTEKIFLLLLVKKYFKLSLGTFALQKTVNALCNSDIIVDIWGIMFADSFRSTSFISKFREGLRLTLRKIVKVPVVKYTAAMGPFESRWNKFFAKFYLNHFVDLIFSRDQQSEEYLKSLEVTTPVYGAPDTAFLLPVSTKYAFTKSKNLIGISVSYQARNRYKEPDNYTSIMSDIIRTLIHKYDAQILLIPNEIEEGKDDDVKIAAEINTLVSDENCSLLDTSALIASEIKQVISQCDVVMAARYHTIIAALSLGIPTLALGWHHKYEGVLKLFHQEHFMIDIHTMTVFQVESLFETMWARRQDIHEEIISHRDQVKQNVLMVGNYILNHIEKN